MFVQVIKGKTSQADALTGSFDRWKAELAPGATGWLGSTGGVTDDGTFIAVARFESEEAARANSSRPEQDAWWTETSELFDGEPTFQESTDVVADVNGDPDRAGFVQVMQGRGNDPERAKELMAQDADRWAELRPDVIGSLAIGHDGGGYTMVMYFTSEAEAREGERQELPPDLQAQMEEMNKLNIGEPEFYDLKNPVMSSPD
jgi:hypothetical protein